MNYFDKYLKYKNKYINLKYKSFNGGELMLSDSDKSEILENNKPFYESVINSLKKGGIIDSKNNDFDLDSKKNDSDSDSDSDSDLNVDPIFKHYVEYLNIDKKKTTIILFKADWCRYCKSFETTWNKLQDDHKNNNNIVFQTYEHSIEKHQVIMNNLNIKGFPHIVLIKNKKYLNYNGSREYNDVFNLINN